MLLLPPHDIIALQPYHQRKDAIKIFGSGLNDVALQVSNVNSSEKLVCQLLVCCRPGAAALLGRVFTGKESRTVSLRAEGLQVQRLLAGSVLVFRLTSPAERLPAGALKLKKALCPCILLWLLRVSAELCICMSSHHHPALWRERGQQYCLGCIPRFVGFLVLLRLVFNPACLKKIITERDVSTL